MTATHRRDANDLLLDQALDWVVLLKTGEPTRADVDALQQWRLTSDDHEQAFRKAARIFRQAGVAAAELAAAPVAIDDATLQRSASHFSTRRAFLGGGAIAAVSAAGYLVVQPPLGLWPSLQELSADYRTGKGEQRKVAVAAGVLLELNTQTSIALRPARDETRVELISGEASATATTASLKPLVMLAASGRITATEADFNARCFDGVVLVTCVSGAIDVAQGGHAKRLRLGEQVAYSAAGIEPSVAVDPGEVTAWQAGVLVFRDQPLASVVDEVNRYRSGKIIITNADLRRRIVNGTFQISKLGDFALQVQQLFGARARSLPGGVVLIG